MRKKAVTPPGHDPGQEKINFFLFAPHGIGPRETAKRLVRNTTRVSLYVFFLQGNEHTLDLVCPFKNFAKGFRATLQEGDAFAVEVCVCVCVCVETFAYGARLPSVSIARKARSRMHMREGRKRGKSSGPIVYTVSGGGVCQPRPE